MPGRLDKRPRVVCGQNNNSQGMNMRNLGSLLIGALLAMAGISAQAQAPQQVQVLPTETFVCNFVGTSDMSDLQDAFDDFNAWADANGIDDLTSFVLTPSYFSEDVDYDVVGLNIWPDGAAFGSGDSLMSSDPDALSSFNGVVDCSSHSLYALVGVKPPAGDVQPGGLFEFSNCTMKGNRSRNEGINAVGAVAQYWSQWNLNDAQAVFANIAGESSDTSYQFKWVTYYPSYETLGSLYDHMVNEGGVQAVDAIVDPVMQCDSSRIYTTTIMRTPAAE